MERADLGSELEAPNHLAQLLERVERTERITIRNRLSHEQASVAAEQDSFFPLRDLSQFFVIIIIAVKTIEPQHSQIGGQAPEMIIKHEARLYRTSIRNRVD